MKLDLKIALVLWIAILGFVFAGVVIMDGAKQAQASTDFGNYNSRQLTSTNASGTAGTRISGPGTLGSVVIIVPSPASSTAPTTLGFYDGTGTATTTATPLFTMPTSTPAGTYTFDVSVTNGLIVDVPRAFTGQVVITHRL